MIDFLIENKILKDNGMLYVNKDEPEISFVRDIVNILKALADELLTFLLNTVKVHFPLQKLLDFEFLIKDLK